MTHKECIALDMLCNCANTPWFICQTILCGILWFQYCQKDFLSSIRRKLNHRLCVRRATIGEEFWGDQVKRLGLQWLQVSAQIWMAHPQSLTDHWKEKWMKTQWTITHLVSPHVRIDSQTAPTWYMKVWAWQFPPRRCHEFGFDNLACRGAKGAEWLIKVLLNKIDECCSICLFASFRKCTFVIVGIPNNFCCSCVVIKNPYKAIWN